jgi:hypothetical protein
MTHILLCFGLFLVITLQLIGPLSPPLFKKCQASVNFFDLYADGQDSILDGNQRAIILFFEVKHHFPLMYF